MDLSLRQQNGTMHSTPHQIFDNHGRPVSYVRLSVTDRCNLRCFYCMPESGINYLPKKELLSYEEMERLLRVMAGMGIAKVRITGGEPFVRRNLMNFLGRVSEIPGIQEIHMTTNGVLTAPYVPELRQMGIRSVNLSLDTLDRERFRQITRRDEFRRVQETYDRLLDSGIPVKINAVVMEGKNIEDILPLVELTRNQPVHVRFIEEMPFNGEGAHYPVLHWTYRRILEYIRTAYPDLQKLPDPPHSTAYQYAVPGFRGTIGIIAAFSRTFCGTCNRIRVTARGDLKTCLYDDGVLNVRDLLRAATDDTPLTEALLRAFAQRPKDGFEAEKTRKNASPASESMSLIGG
jgi:molybdenum cofactor biosynthesis protein A